MIELLFALVFSVSGDFPCDYLYDGVRTYEEIIELCKEANDNYDWELPIYENNYPHDCTVYQPWEAIAEECDTRLVGSGASYVVQDGDLSLWSISQKYGIPFGALLDANPVDPDLIRVGDRINLP